MPSDTKHKNRKTSFLKSIQMYFFFPYLSFFCLFISYLVFMINTNENAQISTQSGQFLSSQISTLYWTLCLSVSLFVCLFVCFFAFCLFIWVLFPMRASVTQGNCRAVFQELIYFSQLAGEERVGVRQGVRTTLCIYHTHTHAYQGVR